MKKSWPLLLVFISSLSQAVLYDDYEIKNTLINTEFNSTLSNYTQRYFTEAEPKLVIDDLLNAELSPLQRESIIFNLLTQISQQPPQDYHQYLVDKMKRYPSQATRSALEGHLPVPIYNLNSKAYGIENIWVAYRTEQKFNHIFENNLAMAADKIKTILAEDSSIRRPKWLGIKNSIAAMKQIQQTDLADYLQHNIEVNSGLDQLLSHVGLLTTDTNLINKALQSELTSVRQFTLRQLRHHLPHEQAKHLLMKSAINVHDGKFSTSLLGVYLSDPVVQDFMLSQLKNKIVAETAAFALSQTKEAGIPEQLKRQFINSSDESEQNHIILALKLNPTSAAQLALDDLKNAINKNSSANKWLQSFDRYKTTGEQQ